MNCFDDNYKLRNSLDELEKFIRKFGITNDLMSLDERFVDMVKEEYGTFNNEFNSAILYYKSVRNSLDDGTVKYCDVFNKKGCYTCMCCNGHSIGKMWILFATFITREQIMSYNGIRFFKY